MILNDDVSMIREFLFDMIFIISRKIISIISYIDYFLRKLAKSGGRLFPYFRYF